MSALADLTGARFGRLVVISRYEKTRPTRWICNCDCGITGLVVASSNLKSGHTKSCGCLHREIVTTHGAAKGGKSSRTYSTWAGMIQRCANPKAPEYANYGGRGIAVCERWLNSFENFLADMGEKPNGKAIDRTNNDGNYEPGNCRWVSQRENNRNSQRSARTAAHLTEIKEAIVNGESPTDIARRIGISRGSVYAIKHGRAWL